MFVSNELFRAFSQHFPIQMAWFLIRNLTPSPSGGPGTDNLEMSVPGAALVPTSGGAIHIACPKSGNEDRNSPSGEGPCTATRRRRMAMGTGGSRCSSDKGSPCTMQPHPPPPRRGRLPSWVKSQWRRGKLLRKERSPQPRRKWARRCV
jgi:hypothetical protein